ncbi:MAG: 2-hydroxyacid dehydrogenase [Janthinobacterium lividum]
MKKILVARQFLDEEINRLRAHFEVDVNDSGDVLTRAAMLQRLADKDGALVAGDPIDAAMLAAAPHLKVVANVGVGYNHFDVPAFTAAGVLATNTPDVLNEATADFGWTLLMAAARRVTEAEHWLRAGHWQGWSFDQFLGADVFGTTLGIVGMGRIGRAIARRARGFNMRVLYHNRSRASADIEAELSAHYVPLDDLLQQADHVVLVVPYVAANHHLIGARELALMKPSATLVNIARGGIVDDKALVDALAARRIAAAGLDVFEGEPALNPGFLALPNVVLAPHIGSATVSSRRAMLRLGVDNLIAALTPGAAAHDVPNPINPQVLPLRAR